MFLLTCLIVVKVPPPFSTSIQDGYLEVGEIMQATWMLGASHGVSHVNPKIPLAVYVWSKLIPFLCSKLVPFWLIWSNSQNSRVQKTNYIHNLYLSWWQTSAQHTHTLNGFEFEWNIGTFLVLLRFLCKHRRLMWSLDPTKRKRTSCLAA